MEKNIIIIMIIKKNTTITWHYTELSELSGPAAWNLRVTGGGAYRGAPAHLAEGCRCPAPSPPAGEGRRGRSQDIDRVCAGQGTTTVEASACCWAARLRSARLLRLDDQRGPNAAQKLEEKIRHFGENNKCVTTLACDLCVCSPKSQIRTQMQAAK